MTEVAKASIGLLLDKGAFEKDVAEAGALAETSIGGAFKKVAGLAAGLLPVAVFAGFVDIGEKFQEAFNTIQQKTGQTGQALKGLEGDFKAVFATTPGATFSNVADALSEIEVRTGLAGKPLDELTQKFIELGKITKTDVAGDVQATTALFNNFGISAANQSKELDVLFKATQLSGVSFSDLTSQMKVAAPAAQILGLNFNQTAALVAQLTEANLPATKVMMGLSMEFAKAAKAGKDPTTVIADMVAQIKAAPKATDAAVIAIKNFGIGARQAATLVDAVRAGTLNFGATLAAITSGKGGIVDTTNATLTLGDRFKLFKNDVLTALEPIAAKALELADALFGKLIPAFDAVKRWVGDIVDTFENHGLGGVVSLLATQVGSLGTTVWNSIVEWTPKIASKIADWAVAFWGWVTDVWPTLTTKLADLYTNVTTWIATNAPKVGGWAVAFWDWVTQVWPQLVTKLGQFYGTLSGWIGTNLPKLGAWIDQFANWISNAWAPLVKKLGDFFNLLWGWIGDRTPTIVAKLGEWSSAFADWVGDVWPKLVKNVETLGKTIGDWITSHVPDMGSWVLGMVNWIRTVFPKAVTELDKLMGQVGNWFDTQATPWMNTHLQKWSEAWGAWMQTHGPDFVTKFAVIGTLIGIYIVTQFVPDLIAKFSAAMLGFMGAVSGTLGSSVLSVLRGLVISIGDAIGSALTSIFNDVVIPILNGIIRVYDDTLGKIPGFPHIDSLTPLGAPPPVAVAPIPPPPAPTVPTPPIPPHLAAAGGIFLPKPGGHLVTVAEAGRAEAILPLSDQMLKALEGLGQGRSTGTGGITTGDIYVTSQKDEKIGRDVVAELRAEAFLLGLG